MIGIVLAGTAGALVLATGAAWGYRRLRQCRVARALAIGPARGIAEGRFVRAGGVDQWIQIRGADRVNPVLLLAGGAGMPMEPFTAALASWEQHFTVVLWDRRDVGRTRGRNGRAGHRSWTFDLLAGDGLDIVEFLRSHLGQEKVVLVGHSQGSVVATAMVRRRPDLFHAYVGTGQIADMARNERETHAMALDRARATGAKKAVRGLERSAPPFRDARAWIAKQRWSMATDPEMRDWRRTAAADVLTWPTYGPADVYRSALGALFLPPRLFEETLACTPGYLGTRFEVPVVLLHGDADLHTLPAIAEEYLAAVDAPRKTFVRLPGTGHLAPLSRPGQFLTELLAHVRPLASTQVDVNGT